MQQERNDFLQIWQNLPVCFKLLDIAISKIYLIYRSSKSQLLAGQWTMSTGHLLLLQINPTAPNLVLCCRFLQKPPYFKLLDDLLLVSVISELWAGQWTSNRSFYCCSSSVELVRFPNPLVNQVSFGTQTRSGLITSQVPRPGQTRTGRDRLSLMQILQNPSLSVGNQAIRE